MTNPRDDLMALAPCPFCHGAAYLHEQEGQRPEDTRYSVHCDECDATHDAPSKDAAVAAWNRRAASRLATQQTTSRIGAWLAAALDDPKVCAKMKADIEAWMNAGEPSYLPAPVEAAKRDTWNWRKHDEIIKRLMEQVGMPNSRSLYQAFKQFANELHHMDLGASATASTTPNAVDEPVEAEGVGEPKPAGWQRSLKYAHVPEWEQCSTSEATSHFDRSPYYDYRPLYTHPPKSPDTSAAVLQSHALKQALDCLSEIAAAHIPDCPAHYAGDELSWAQRHVGSLRHKAEIARDGIAAAIRQLPTSKLVNPEKMYSYNSEAKVEFEK